jgi:hypothetical protein
MLKEIDEFEFFLNSQLLVFALIKNLIVEIENGPKGAMSPHSRDFEDGEGRSSGCI